MTVVDTYAGSTPVDVSGTRAKLIAAGERIFASDGIHGALMRGIVRAAAQSNDSAVHYHFGSRQGSLRAICERHIDEMERRRRLLEQLQQVQALCARTMPGEVAGERIAIMIGALTAALADRAGGVDEGTDFSLDDTAFVDNLVAMLVAALQAPVPAAAR